MIEWQSLRCASHQNTLVLLVQLAEVVIDRGCAHRFNEKIAITLQVLCRTLCVFFSQCCYTLNVGLVALCRDRSSCAVCKWLRLSAHYFSTYYYQCFQNRCPPRGRDSFQLCSVIPLEYRSMWE